MATLTVTRPDVFPDGTSLSAYPRQVQRFAQKDGDTDAPLGTAAATATVSAGTVSLTGLADGTRYDIVGLVAGKYRRVQMATPEVNTGLAGVQTATNQPNGLPHPKWRQRRRALGLV